MPTVPTLPGITSKIVDTPRLKQHVLFSGPENGTPVLFVHGNASSASYWEEIMLKLPAGFRGIAPDLRGYGDTEDKLVDATRGMGDWIDDIAALLDALKVEKTHVVGHSMGGTIVFGLVGLAALGGVLAAPSSGLSNVMGESLFLNALIALAIGGLTNYPGAALGSVIVGMIQQFIIKYGQIGIAIPFTEIIFKPTPPLVPASTVMLMVIILLILPNGLLGKKE